jgi:3-oxoacyl-[acyl-carrier protein] reductase
LDLDLKNKSVLIAGSSQGIGKAIACGFATEGARVILTGRSSDNLKKAQSEITQQKNTGEVATYCGDLTVPSAVDGLMGYIKEKFETLDHCVFNIGSGRSVPVFTEDSEEFIRMLEMNLVVSQRLASSLTKIMQSTAENNASLTFVGSICGMHALGAPSGYSAAKEGLWGYVKSIARPLAARGIRVNMVSPGNIIFEGSVWETKISENKEAVKRMLSTEVPMGRFGTTAEVAAAIVFLASSQAAFITGTNLKVDGGQLRS